MQLSPCSRRDIFFGRIVFRTHIMCARALAFAPEWSKLTFVSGRIGEYSLELYSFADQRLWCRVDPLHAGRFGLSNI